MWLPSPSVKATRPVPSKLIAVVVEEIGILFRVHAAGAEPDLPLRLVDAVDAADDVFPWVIWFLIVPVFASIR